MEENGKRVNFNLNTMPHMENKLSLRKENWIKTNLLLYLNDPTTPEKHDEEGKESINLKLTLHSTVLGCKKVRINDMMKERGNLMIVTYLRLTPFHGWQQDGAKYGESQRRSGN